MEIRLVKRNQPITIPPPCHPSSSFVENAVKLESGLFGSALGCMNDWMDGLIDGMIDF